MDYMNKYIGEKPRGFTASSREHKGILGLSGALCVKLRV